MHYRVQTIRLHECSMTRMKLNNFISQARYEFNALPEFLVRNYLVFCLNVDLQAFKADFNETGQNRRLLLPRSRGNFTSSIQHTYLVICGSTTFQPIRNNSKFSFKIYFNQELYSQSDNSIIFDGPDIKIKVLPATILLGSLCYKLTDMCIELNLMPSDL